MKWLKRGCWILAWGVWLALGVGLHHQLPRELGPFVRRLWSESAYIPLGFVGDTNDFLVKTPTGGAFPQLDGLLMGAESGAIRDRRLPPFTKDGDFDNGTSLNLASLKFGFLFGSKPTGEDGGEVRYEGLHALDVQSGVWREFSQDPATKFAVHADRTWMAFSPRSTTALVEAVDFRTGRKLFSRELPSGSRLYNDPFFLPGRATLVLPLIAPTKSGLSGHVFEVWNLADPPTLEETVDDVGGWNFAVSSNGRMRFEGKLLKESGAFKHYDVYDFNERKFLTSSPPSEQPAANNGEFTSTISMEFSPAISPSENTVLRFGRSTGELDARGIEYFPQALYEVGTGRNLWRTNPFETVTESHGEDGFLVEEKWHDLWRKWLPNFKFETIACRSLEDGSLIYRTTAEKKIEPRLCNASRTLVVLADGTVHRLPLSVNWLLLALCQTILVLPLVLTWAFLRWRKKRALNVSDGRLHS